MTAPQPVVGGVGGGVDSAVGVGGVGVADGEGAIGVTWWLACVVVVCWRGCCWCWCWARPAFGWSAVPGVPLLAGGRSVRGPAGVAPVVSGVGEVGAVGGWRWRCVATVGGVGDSVGGSDRILADLIPELLLQVLRQPVWECPTYPLVPWRSPHRPLRRSAPNPG